MYDFSKEIFKFHDQHITLTRGQQNDMRSRREANLKRIKAGLEELGKPSVAETINQGGYAQKTMTQPPEANEDSRYDIDMGVVFDKDDSVGPKSTRRWVRDAIARKAVNMKNDPELKKKCVRVVYANGYQCDFPVFRRELSGQSFSYEISTGEEWEKSDPRAINKWFEDEISNKSPDNGGRYQLRRIARMLKYFCKVHAHRRNRKFPAGLVATALAVEAYKAEDGRDDLSFRETLRYLSTRSEHNPVFANGLIISDEKDADRIRRLADEAREVVEHLDGLNGNATESDARRAWRKVFRHSFFVETVSSELASLTAAERAERMQASVNARQTDGNAGRPWCH